MGHKRTEYGWEILCISHKENYLNLYILSQSHKTSSNLTNPHKSSSKLLKPLPTSLNLSSPNLSTTHQSKPILTNHVNSPPIYLPWNHIILQNGSHLTLIDSSSGLTSIVPSLCKFAFKRVSHTLVCWLYLYILI